MLGRRRALRHDAANMLPHIVSQAVRVMNSGNDGLRSTRQFRGDIRVSCAAPGDAAAGWMAEVFDHFECGGAATVSSAAAPQVALPMRPLTRWSRCAVHAARVRPENVRGPASPSRHVRYGGLQHVD